jgi:N-acyl-D-aspartate/D-glutamate deacylase
MILNGAGDAPFTTDIALAGGRIAMVGDCRDRDAAVRIDCRGRAVAPAFIDACSQIGQAESVLSPVNSATAQGIATTVGPADFETLATPERVREGCEAGAFGVHIDLATADAGEALAAARGARAGRAARAYVSIAPGGIDAAIALANAADVAVHITHLSEQTSAPRGALERTLLKIDAARERGLEITCDGYPYRATWITLESLLPAGITREALGNEAFAATVAMEMTARLGPIWHDLMLAEVGSEHNLAWCGMRFDAIAAQMRLSGARAVLAFIIEDGAKARAFHFCIEEDDLAMLYSAGFCAIGSNAPVLLMNEERLGLAHPRAYGTFPRMFGRFVRGRRILTREEAVRRMTTLPAHIFGLNDRGTIAAGRRADIVVFDAERFTDTATYAHPASFPEGLEHLFIEGEAVIGGTRR